MSLVPFQAEIRPTHKTGATKIMARLSSSVHVLYFAAKVRHRHCDQDNDCGCSDYPGEPGNSHVRVDVLSAHCGRSISLSRRPLVQLGCPELHSCQRDRRGVQRNPNPGRQDGLSMHTGGAERHRVVGYPDLLAPYYLPDSASNRSQSTAARASIAFAGETTTQTRTWTL